MNRLLRLRLRQRPETGSDPARPPDLLGESPLRARRAGHAPYARGTVKASELPDPYGPDPIVFGPVQP